MLFTSMLDKEGEANFGKQAWSVPCNRLLWRTDLGQDEETGCV